MTIFNETSTGIYGVHAPIVAIEIGDTINGTVGATFSPEPFSTFTDTADAITINLTPGATYTFTIPLSEGSFNLGASINADGDTLASASYAANSGETSGLTLTFVAPASGQITLNMTGGNIYNGPNFNQPIMFSSQLNYSISVSEIIAPTATDGDDVLFGGDAPTTLDLVDGNDTWTGVSSTDAFVRGMYIDSINGGLGDDSIFGGLGNDAIDGGSDNDLIDLGEGNDNAWGGQGDDILFGGTGHDRINGNSGDDSLFGGKGGDIITGGKGEDYIEGGSQSDKIWGGAQADEIYGGTGDDIIYGQAGFDLIFGGSGGDRLYGGSFDDVIYGGHGGDILIGGSGDDELHGDQSNDKLSGNSGDDLIFGGSGNDNMNGGSDNDELYGGNQSDNIKGGTGDDILYGGLGDDVLSGGDGADTFVFNGVVNHDVIKDFEVGVDTIDFTRYGPISIEDTLLVGSQTDNGVLLDLKGNGSVLLEGISLTDLSIGDFAFIPDLGDDLLVPIEVFDLV